MGAGRKLCDDSMYALELGFPIPAGKKIVKRLGGADRLRSLSPEIRALLMTPWKNEKGKELTKGGLSARGFKRAMDIRSQE